MCFIRLSLKEIELVIPLVYDWILIGLDQIRPKYLEIQPNIIRLD